MSNISNFKNNFQGGVRPNQFKISVFAPSIGSANLEFLGKAASIPASVIGNIDVPYLGRQLKVPGDRIFEDWNLTVFNDAAWQNRSFFERWMDRIQDNTNPVRSGSSNSVYGSAIVTQLDRSGVGIATYYVRDMYPTNLAAIELDWGTNDAVEEFQVTFAINNWTSSHDGINTSGSSGTNIDFNVSTSIGGVNINAGTGGFSIST
jgi:hypothetical protein